MSAYPSPLAGFRDYTKDVPASVSVYGKELLATTGLPAGSRVRIAAMDTYDGLAWGVANAAASTRRSAASSGSAPLLPGAVARRDAGTATITDRSRAYAAAVAARPGRDDRVRLHRAGRPPPRQAALRFNVATTTGIIPGGVPAGLRYTVSAAAVAAAAHVRSWPPRAPRARPDPSIVIPAAVQAFAAGARRLGDHATRQGPRARRVPAGQRPVQQRRRRAERDHRRARLGPAHLVPRGQADRRRRRAVRRRDGAARQRGRRPRPGQP